MNNDGFLMYLCNIMVSCNPNVFVFIWIMELAYAYNMTRYIFIIVLGLTVNPFMVNTQYIVIEDFTLMSCTSHYASKKILETEAL